jgi:hypothetical protein
MFKVLLLTLFGVFIAKAHSHGKPSPNSMSFEEKQQIFESAKIRWPNKDKRIIPTANLWTSTNTFNDGGNVTGKTNIFLGIVNEILKIWVIEPKVDILYFMNIYLFFSWNPIFFCFVLFFFQYFLFYFILILFKFIGVVFHFFLEI